METLIFGHLFFEMSFGLELDDVVPDYTGTHPTRRFYDHPVRRVLDLIFEGGNFLHMNQQQEEQMQRNTGENKNIGEEVGGKADTVRVTHTLSETTETQTAGEGSNSEATLTPNTPPTWQTRKSKKRLDLKHLCAHIFFQCNNDNHSVTCNKGPTIVHSKQRTWEENEACHDKVLHLARLYHRRKWSRYVRRKKRMTVEESNRLSQEEKLLMEWSKMEPEKVQQTDRRRKSTNRRPSTGVVAIGSGLSRSEGGTSTTTGERTPVDSATAASATAASAVGFATNPVLIKYQQLVTAGVPLPAVQHKMYQEGLSASDVATVCGSSSSCSSGGGGGGSSGGGSSGGGRNITVKAVKVVRVEHRSKIASVPTITPQRGGLLAAIRGGAQLKKMKTPPPIDDRESNGGSGGGGGGGGMMAEMRIKAELRQKRTAEKK